MFKFGQLADLRGNIKHKTLDVITIFHKANSPSSQKVLNLLRQVSVKSSTIASKDQINSAPSSQRDEFQLEVTEELPTQDQLRSILEYVGASKIGSIVKGARDGPDAWKNLRTNPDTLQRPIVIPSNLRGSDEANDFETVDWAHGRAVATTDESEILNMIYSRSIKKP